MLNLRISGAGAWDSCEVADKNMWVFTWYCLDENHNPTVTFTVEEKPFSLTDKGVLFRTHDYNELISWLENN